MSDKVGPTALGKLFIFLFIVVLLGGAAYFFRDLLAPLAGDEGQTVDLDKFKQQQGVEAPDAAGITTVSEYSYVPNEKLPPVQGVSNYTWNKDDPVVEFPINVWIGWLPIVAANHGFRPNEDSLFFKEFGFKVNLKLIDDPVIARHLRRGQESCPVGHPRHDGPVRPRADEGLAHGAPHLPADRLVERR